MFFTILTPPRPYTNFPREVVSQIIGAGGFVEPIHVPLTSTADVLGEVVLPPHADAEIRDRTTHKARLLNIWVIPPQEESQ